jgi:hypothetical protein
MINTYNGSFLTIEAFNIGNTIKRPITLNAYGGNVGIGITNPSQTLDVYGGISTIVTSILNTSFNIPADTTTRYLYFSGLTTGYNLSVEVTMASYGYGDLVDARFMKFSFVAAIRSNGTGATGTVSSLTSFGAGATNNITIGTPIAGLSYIAVPIVRTTTLYSTYYYTITAICTSVGNNKPKKVEFGL